MSDRFTELEAALERVIEAARAHLIAARDANGTPDDDGVWDAYVALNNTAVQYDDLLHEIYGEVTPWELSPIGGEEESLLASTLVSVEDSRGDDPHPSVISVRQRRDYRVPSVSALLRAAEESRSGDEGDEPVITVADAVLELLQSGDGSLAMLDVPELEPLDGVIVVAEVSTPLAADIFDELADSTADTAFQLGDGDKVVGRVHESSMPDDGE